MKALSVRQPWASLIASGQKTIELRSWPTKYRGRLLICSGVSIASGTEYPIGPRGVALCTVELVDVRLATGSDAKASFCPDLTVEDELFAWVLADARAVDQRQIKGRLGLFDVDGIQ